MKVLELIDQHGAGIFTEDDLHRLDGALPGYKKTDVEQFIARIAQMRAGRSAPARGPTPI